MDPRVNVLAIAYSDNFDVNEWKFRKRLYHPGTAKKYSLGARAHPRSQAVLRKAF